MSKSKPEPEKLRFLQVDFRLWVRPDDANLQDVLDRLREDGAAKIQNVEVVEISWEDLRKETP